MLGARSPGVRERTISCAPAVPASGCAPRRSEAPRNEAKKHCGSNGPLESRSPRSIGSPLSKRTFHSALWSISQKCGGGSSAITWSSSKKSASGTTRAAGGRASIITAHFAFAVYGFLISEREMIPPSGPHCAGKLKNPAIPDSYRPRGAADPAPTSRSQLDRHAASTLDRRDRKNAAKMSILRKQIQKEQAPCFLTQYD